MALSSNNTELNKFNLLIFIILYQMILLFSTNIISIFYQVEIGGAIIALSFIILFVLLFFMKNNPIIPGLEKSKIYQKFQNLKHVTAIRLYMLFVILVTISGCLIRYYLILTIPLLPEISDMLPLIQKAGDVFLQGGNPYQIYYFSYPLPLTFWPGLWMPYLPATLLNFDPRWIGLFFWILISILLITFSLKKYKENHHNHLLLLSGISIFTLQFSYHLLGFHAFGHTFPLWFMMTLMVIALLDKRNLLSAFCLGFLLSTRQTSLILIPIVFAYWVSKNSLANSIKYLLIAILSFSIISLPFYVSTPEQFLQTPIQHYKKLGEYFVHLGKQGKAIETIGFSYLIQKYWGVNILNYLSYLSVLLISLFSFIVYKNPKQIAIWMSISMIFFSFFTPIPWTYEYYPPMIMMTLALLN